MYDAIIIGKGPAGISAAIYLKRAGFSCVVLGKDKGSLEKAEIIENFYGQPPTSGAKLSDAGIRQAKRLGIPVISEEVVSVEITQPFTVKTQKAEYHTHTILFATGKKRKNPQIPGINKFVGSGVSFCSVCDGFFFKNKDVAVIGNGDYALSEALYLKNFAKNVTIFTNAEPLATEKLREFPLIEDAVIKVDGGERIESIVTDKTAYPIDGLFVAMGSAGATEFALKLGLEVSNGNVIVDESFSTNIPGIFAAGDCIGGFLQVSKAVADGASSATAMTKYIREAKKAVKA